MGIFDFFKKRKKEQEIPEKQELNFKNIPEWVEKEEKEINFKEKEIFNSIKRKISETREIIDERLEILEGIDIDSKKSENKIKVVVKENLQNYIKNVEKLLNELSALEEKSLKEIFNELNKKFADFEKKSYLNYQKATILIGKELADVKEKTVELSNYFKNIFKENKELIEKCEKLRKIKKDYKQYNENKELIERYEENIKDIDKKIKLLNDKFKETEKEISEFKQTNEYIENQEKKEKLNKINSELEREIYNLKELINFKSLTSFFHSNKKQFNLVKEYKENFKEKFTDNEEEIKKMLKESNLLNDKISKKIDLIKNKKEEISNLRNKIKKDKTEDMIGEKERIKKEIHEIEYKKNSEKKSKEKLETKNKELEDMMKNYFDTLNININLQ